MTEEVTLKNIFLKAKENLDKIYDFYGGEDIEGTYLKCPERNANMNMDNVFEGFIRALQNGSNIGPNAIKFESDNKIRIIKVCNSDESEELKLEKFQYENADNLYKAFGENGLCPKESKQNSAWYKFAEGIVAGAKKLKTYTYGEFESKFDIKLPELDKSCEAQICAIEAFYKDIPNIGFELTCDFLKELGFEQYGKPDVHIRNIFFNLGLTNKIKDDKQAFKKIQEIARAVSCENSHKDITAYYVDKVFWLLASGKFYKHQVILSKREMLTALFAPKDINQKHCCLQNKESAHLL